MGRRRRVAMGVALACLLGASAGRAQLQGHISMAKEVYLAGEPIYVHFEVTNVGKDAVQYSAGNTYSQGCGGYTIEVLSGPAAAHTTCRGNLSSECIVVNQMLPAGETERQNILVNYEFARAIAKPGDYKIHAARVMKYGPLGAGPIPSGNQEFKLEATLSIHVEKADRETLQAIYQVYVRNLGVRDDEIQREAERAIVSGAPPWLENTIVGMLRKSTSREFALLGLRNLNTPRAREELANIVRETSGYTEQSELAIRYLAEMGDKKYYPLLLETAKQQEAREGRDYVLAAAQLGGDEALPYLTELLKSEDGFARANGVIGLEKTGSRAAVPLLIEALKDPKPDFEKLVVQGLESLTHRSAGESERGDAPRDQAGKWEKWWAENGEKAKIYGPGECGEIEELP